MKITALMLISFFVLAVILPDTTPRRPRTVRLSRSATTPSFQRFLVAEDVQREAKKAVANLKRAALIPLTASGTVDGIDAFAVTMNIENDLHYVSGLLPSDITSMLAEADASDSSTEQIQKIAQRLQAELVITGSLNEKNHVYHLQLVAYQLKNDALTTIAKSQAEGTATELAAAGDRALLTLLEQLHFTPVAEARQQMTMVPTNNPDAMRECAYGFQLLLRAMSAAGDQETDTTDLSNRALEHANRALAADPDFTLAYLVKASAQDNLQQPAGVKLTLQAAKTRLNRADRLTQLELRGDFERLTKKDKNWQTTASQYYEEMLKFDPGHLRALLSLVECYAAENERPPDVDLERAAHYAARIQAAHPGSPIAKLFAP